MQLIGCGYFSDKKNSEFPPITFQSAWYTIKCLQTYEARGFSQLDLLILATEKMRNKVIFKALYEYFNNNK